MTPLQRARRAGYHDQADELRRLIAKGDVGQEPLYAAYAQGVVARLRGTPCECDVCVPRPPKPRNVKPTVKPSGAVIPAEPQRLFG